MSKIIISSDIKQALDQVVNDLADSPKLVLEKDDFLIDDAGEVIKEAYKASDQTKYIITCAESYNRFAQNSLLKILEEPPRNIDIILIAPRKSIFLPTIRSRLMIEYKKSQKEPKVSLIDFDKLDIKEIYNFVKTHSYTSKENAKTIVETATDWYAKNLSKTPSARVLEALQRSYYLLNINTPAVAAVLPLLLIILEEKNGSKTTR